MLPSRSAASTYKLVVFPAAVVLTTLRRYSAAAFREAKNLAAGSNSDDVENRGDVDTVHSRNDDRVEDLDLSQVVATGLPGGPGSVNVPAPVLLCNSVAIALKLNPITPDHHTVWWRGQQHQEEDDAERPGCGCAVAERGGGSADVDALSVKDRLHFFNSVREVQFLLSAKTGCSDFNISWQEGAGLPVPGGLRSWTRYVHVVPRASGDLEGDAVHELLADWTWKEGLRATPSEPWPSDGEREDRTSAVMATEAAAYRELVWLHRWQRSRGNEDSDRGDDSLSAKALEISEASTKVSESDSSPNFVFGRIPIPKEQVFFESSTQSTVAFVNLRPLRPGHVLVSPRRSVQHLADLTIAEYEDLVLAVAEVAQVFRSQAKTMPVRGDGHPQHHGNATPERKTMGFIFAVQDGENANQSIPHVHVHVIPR
eukprot:INCI16231.1.p1 GENE.INCI16231.1~~INCI16231.1.p1  ORF type:complete len:427 (-),score=54.34 INCI16231.1:51-1331(-)